MAKPRRKVSIWDALAVLVALFLLVLVLFPSITITDRRAKIAQCSGNLKAVGSVLAIYSAANSDGFPQWPASTPLRSLCEQPRDYPMAPGLATGLAGTTPAGVKSGYYCPLNAAQDPAVLWPPIGPITWGYMTMFDRGAASPPLPPHNPARRSPLQYLSKLSVARDANETGLALDVIVTRTNTAPTDFAPTGVAVPFGTNHNQGPQNITANVLAVDGHVELRHFDPASATAIQQPGGGYFWIPNP